RRAVRDLLARPAAHPVRGHAGAGVQRPRRGGLVLLRPRLPGDRGRGRRRVDRLAAGRMGRAAERLRTDRRPGDAGHQRGGVLIPGHSRARGVTPCGGAGPGPAACAAPSAVPPALSAVPAGLSAVPAAWSAVPAGPSAAAPDGPPAGGPAAAALRSLSWERANHAAPVTVSAIA